MGRISILHTRIIKTARFFAIIFWMILYCIRNWINPAILSKLNPGILNGGKASASKIEIYNHVTKNNSFAKKIYAKTIYLPHAANNLSIHKLVAQLKKDPIVLKPNIGARSIGVYVTNNNDECVRILDAREKFDYIAQEYIPYEYEVGIYYYKYPEWKSGKILGIAEKNSRTIIGNGSKSLKALITDSGSHVDKSVLAHLLYHYKTLDYIPKKSEIIMLAGTADHDTTEGYSNRSDLITFELENVINKILEGKDINFCRFDIRARTLEKLREGKDFKIMELNVGPDAVLLHAFDKRHLFREQLEIYFEGYKHAFEIAKLTKKHRIGIIKYAWYMIEDILPLQILRFKMRNIN